MARTKGSFNNPNSFEVTVSAPLDARQRVDTDADLINANTWITGGMDYAFEGMLAYSQQSKSYWMLTALPATNVNNWKQIAAGSTGDPSETYATTATLSTAINGLTTISASTTSKSIADFFAYRTLVNDKDGTVAVVDNVTGSNIVVRTITTSGALRQGVRIGAVATETNLPATVAAAEAAGFVTPVNGDYMNVRKDSTHDNKLAVYLITNIDNSGNITWLYDHTINDGDYQEQSTTAMTGKILTGGTTQGTFGTPIDVSTFVKDVKLNGTTLTKDAAGAVNVTAPVQSITVDGTPQVPDAAGNVALSKGVDTISINGVNVPKDANNNVDLPAFVKTISVDGTNVPQDAAGNVDLTGLGGGNATYVVRVNNREIHLQPEQTISIPFANITAITKGGQAVTPANFRKDLVLKEDYVVLHGTYGTLATDEFVAIATAVNTTEITLEVLFNTGKDGNGILAEGDVRGVRGYFNPFTTAVKNWDNPDIIYKDGDDNMIDSFTASDGTKFTTFKATADGLYFYAFRPFSGQFLGNVDNTIVITIETTSDKGTTWQEVETVKYKSSKTDSDGGYPPAATGVVKMKKDDFLVISTMSSIAFNAKSTDPDVETMAGLSEFWQISERSDGLVAEAEYDSTQVFAANKNNFVKFVNSTNTNVLKDNGDIVLPEEGYYILDAEWQQSASTASAHPTRASVTDASGTTLQINEISSVTTMISPGITAAFGGKKGEVFHYGISNGAVTCNSGKKLTGGIRKIRLFKMSFAGSGGSGGGGTWGSITGTLANQTDLQTELNNKQDTLTAGKNVKITNNKIDVADLDSKVDYEYTEATETLKLLAGNESLELTAEHTTGEMWNGKPVYEVTFEATVPSSSSSSIANLSQYNIEKVVDFNGVVRYTNGDNVPLGYWSSANNFITGYYSETNKPGNFVIVFGGSWANSTLRLTIRYTKK